MNRLQAIAALRREKAVRVLAPWRRCRLWFLVVLLLAGAVPTRADMLVTTADGGQLQVTSYEVDGDWARLSLVGGGFMSLRVDRIERVVDEAADDLPELPTHTIPLMYATDQGVPATPFGRLIYDAARRSGVNPKLVAAMVKTESAFEPEAVSHKGARGLMQLMPATAERFGVAAADLFDPEKNLAAGTKYLGWLIERYGASPLRVLAAYNAGEAAVDKYGGVPPYRETRDYIRKIFADLAPSQ